MRLMPVYAYCAYKTFSDVQLLDAVLRGYLLAPPWTPSVVFPGGNGASLAASLTPTRAAHL
jgi:hypothetical protein